MSAIDKSQLKATPETEDFAHKYTEEGQGKIGRKLLDGYFSGVESLVAQSNIADTGKIKAIELGCGEGFSTQRLRDMLPATVTLSASEYVADMVPRAQQLNPKVKVIEESVYDTTHKSESFDLVFLLEVMEHLDYPSQALAEISRILKPNGFLVLGVPREPLWCSLNVARGKYLAHLGNTPGHLNHWSTVTLKRFVKSQGYTIHGQRNPVPWTQLLLQKTA